MLLQAAFIPDDAVEEPSVTAGILKLLFSSFPFPPFSIDPAFVFFLLFILATPVVDQTRLVIWSKLIGASEPTKEEKEKEKIEKEKAVAEGFLDVSEGRRVKAEGMALLHKANVKQIAWHAKGNYLASGSLLVDYIV